MHLSLIARRVRFLQDDDDCVGLDAWALEWSMDHGREASGYLVE